MKNKIEVEYNMTLHKLLILYVKQNFQILKSIKLINKHK